MCLIAWNWQPDSDTPLVLLGNRDEFYARPTLPLHWWDGNAVLAGKDLQAGGTWLGVAPGRRLAAITNYRLPTGQNSPRPSRGELTTRFLQGSGSARAYLEALRPLADQYNPFNLLLWDGSELLGLESRHQRIVEMEPGIGAVSNADFGTPWPKLVQLRQKLDAHLAEGAPGVENLLPLLQDSRLAEDADLPDTGIAPAMERVLSAIWIASPQYGTRASSIVVINHQQSYFYEQSYGEHGMLGSAQHFFTP